MMLLGVDASQPKGGLALYDGQVRWEGVWEDAHSLSVLKEACSQARIQEICLGVGPGRLSGLRAAASFVSGYAEAASCRVSVVSSLLILASAAYQTTGEASWHVLLDARLGAFFFASYHFSKDEIHVDVAPRLVSEWPVGRKICGLEGALADRLDCVFESMPVGSALDQHAHWRRSGCLREVGADSIELLYLRAAVEGL